VGRVRRGRRNESPNSGSYKAEILRSWRGEVQYKEGEEPEQLSGGAFIVRRGCPVRSDNLWARQQLAAVIVVGYVWVGKNREGALLHCKRLHIDMAIKRGTGSKRIIDNNASRRKGSC
jgi:hypothetical protein